MSRNYKDDGLDFEALEMKRKLNDFLARGRVSDAIRFLDKFSNNQQLLLFEPKTALKARCKLAWLYKINLLRSVGCKRRLKIAAVGGAD